MQASRAPSWLAVAFILASLPLATSTQAVAPPSLPAPVFHHLHLESVNPDAAIAGYLQLWPDSTKRTTVEGVPAVENGRVYLLFDRVSVTPPTRPQSAFRHQVRLTPNVREYVARARRRGMPPAPLYTSEDGGTVDVSSDILPGTLTRAGLAEAKQKGIAPTRQAGYT